MIHLGRALVVPVPVSVIPVASALREGDVRAGQDVTGGVWEVRLTIADPGDRQGRRHELVTVLVVGIGAVLAGARTVAGIAGMVRWPPLAVST